MRLTFRPYAGITAFFAVLFAVLIGLGVWQLQRLQWKLALIDEVQRSMAGQNTDVPQDMRIELRIGIHVGDIIIDEDDIFGDGVNIAARLEGIAEPGGVW